MSHPLTNRQWVTLLNFFARLSHQSSLIPWQTASEWQHFIPLPGSSLINHVSSHDQQAVSDTALFLCQVISESIMSCHMINSEWATLLYFFAHHLTLTWPQIVSVTKFSTNCKFKFHCPSPSDQQSVSNMSSLLVTSLHITNRKWVTMYLFFIGIYHLMTNSMCVIHWLLMATSHSSYCMSNRKWVVLHSNDVQHSQSLTHISLTWPIESRSYFRHNMLLCLMS